VELICYINHQQTTKLEAWFGTIPARILRAHFEQPRGSVFFWELRDAYFSLNLDPYVDIQLVELICYLNHQQATKREARFGTNSASTLCEDRAAKGLRFFVGASRRFFF
jgi:hypothetical protein